MASNLVLCDQEAFESIKEGSRSNYVKIWEKFVKFCGFDEKNAPKEEQVLKLIKKLRYEENAASSSLWTYYSMLNSCVKAKYGFNLKHYSRVTTQLKAFDTDVKKKANIFTKEEIDHFLSKQELGTPYWKVRKCIVIFAFFGGLRKIELESLLLENISSTPEGVSVLHSRAKQRTDVRNSKFVIPRMATGVNYAAVAEEYLVAIRNDLGQVTGNVWWTGRNVYVKTHLGKNIIARIPKEMAEQLKIANSSGYSFHSYRRSSATEAANQGLSAVQLQQHFGWANPSMCQEYISTSKAAVMDIAGKLAGNSPIMGAGVAGCSKNLQFGGYSGESSSGVSAVSGESSSAVSAVSGETITDPDDKNSDKLVAEMTEKAGKVIIIKDSNIEVFRM